MVYIIDYLRGPVSGNFDVKIDVIEIVIIDGDCYWNLQNTVQVIIYIQSHLRLISSMDDWMELQFNRNTGKTLEKLMAGDSS